VLCNILHSAEKPPTDFLETFPHLPSRDLIFSNFNRDRMVLISFADSPDSIFVDDCKKDHQEEKQANQVKKWLLPT
jgi:hypothetical protein